VQSQSFRRKRKNIVRDWFFFIVWYVRLRKILKHHRSSAITTNLRAMIFGTKINDLNS
jgi:hypothetical protein